MASGNTLEGCYKSWCTKSDGLTTKDMTAWFKEAGVINKKFSSNSADILFSKHRNKSTKLLDMKCLEAALDDIGKESGLGKDGARDKLADKPKVGKVGPTSKTGGVDRLTDVGGYTGAHKERFDAKTGKGKGIEGRVDRDDHAASGYVGGYKGSDTYDKKHGTKK